MIQTVELINYRNESLTLTLTRPELSGIGVQKIEGLGAPKMDISTTSIYSMDGALVGQIKAEPRNITLDLFPMAYPSVETSRQLLYQYLPLKTPVKVIVGTENRMVAAEGYVEENEPDIFTLPETVHISIICPDPYFYDAFMREFRFRESIPMFEFPFSNESTEEGLLEFSELNDANEMVVDYYGDVETGFIVHIRWGSENHSLGDIQVHNLSTGEVMTISDALYQQTVNNQYNNKPVLSGNRLGYPGIELTIDSRENHRSAVAVREDYMPDIYNWNITPALGRDPVWLTIRPGRQVFALFSTNYVGELDVSFEVMNRYMGV